jgi:hypothetical protein
MMRIHCFLIQFSDQKLRADNPGACAREYNSIMQIIMEAWIGWDFKEGKQSFF